MRNAFWAHKKKFKNKVFFGNYEYNKAGKRVIKFKDAVSGKETKAYPSFAHAAKDGWYKIKV